MDQGANLLLPGMVDVVAGGLWTKLAYVEAGHMGGDLIDDEKFHGRVVLLGGFPHRMAAEAVWGL